MKRTFTRGGTGYVPPESTKTGDGTTTGTSTITFTGGGQRIDTTTTTGGVTRTTSDFYPSERGGSGAGEASSLTTNITAQPISSTIGETPTQLALRSRQAERQAVSDMQKARLAQTWRDKARQADIEGEAMLQEELLLRAQNKLGATPTDSAEYDKVYSDYEKRFDAYHNTQGVYNKQVDVINTSVDIYNQQLKEKQERYVYDFFNPLEAKGIPVPKELRNTQENIIQKEQTQQVVRQALLDRPPTATDNAFFNLAEKQRVEKTLQPSQYEKIKEIGREGGLQVYDRANRVIMGITGVTAAESIWGKEAVAAVPKRVSEFATGGKDYLYIPLITPVPLPIKPKQLTISEVQASVEGEVTIVGAPKELAFIQTPEGKLPVYEKNNLNLAFRKVKGAAVEFNAAPIEQAMYQPAKLLAYYGAGKVAGYMIKGVTPLFTFGGGAQTTTINTLTKFGVPAEQAITGTAKGFSTAGKIGGYALAGLYAGGVAMNVAAAPTFEEGGRRLGAEVLPTAVFFGGIETSPTPKYVKQTNYQIVSMQNKAEEVLKTKDFTRVDVTTDVVAKDYGTGKTKSFKFYSTQYNQPVFEATARINMQKSKEITTIFLQTKEGIKYKIKVPNKYAPSFLDRLKASPDDLFVSNMAFKGKMIGKEELLIGGKARAVTQGGMLGEVPAAITAQKYSYTAGKESGVGYANFASKRLYKIEQAMPAGTTRVNEVWVDWGTAKTTKGYKALVGSITDIRLMPDITDVGGAYSVIKGVKVSRPPKPTSITTPVEEVKAIDKAFVPIKIDKGAKFSSTSSIAQDVALKAASQDVIYTSSIGAGTTFGIMGVKPRASPDEMIKSKEEFEMLPAEKGLNKLGTYGKEEYKFVDKSMIDIGTKIRGGTGTGVATSFIEAPAQDEGLKQEQPQRERQRQGQKTPPPPPPFILKTPPPPPPPPTPFKITTKPAAKGSKGFELFVKRKGAFQKVGGIMLKQKAIQLGESIAAGTLAATFKLQPTKKLVIGTERRYIPSQMFRAYKISKGKQIPLEDTWVQKEKFRLASRTERIEIQAARKKKSKGGVKWI